MNAQSKQIVFDWNGTLFDDTQLIVDVINKVFLHYGYPTVDYPTYQARYEVPFEKLYRNHGLSDAEIERVMKTQGDLFHDHYEPAALAASLRAGAMEILSFSRDQGVRNVILSNHIVDKIRDQLQRLAIENYFADVLAYADRATQFKNMTKGERLRRFMAEHRMNPAHTMIIGDSVEEIHIAKEQGFISVAITGGCVSEKRLQAEGPDHVIHSLSELKPILYERGFAS